MNILFSLFGETAPSAAAAPEAAKTVLASYPATDFLIVGEGTEADALKKQAADLGIAGNVIFAGFAEDVAPYYGIMDLNLN